MNFLDQLFALLTGPEGSLFYHLVLAFSIMAALQGAFAQWRVTEFPQARRMVIGLTVLMSAQVILFVVSGLAWQGMSDPNLILPPLDRAVILFSLVWVTWLWAFPEPQKSADAATALLNLLIVVGLVFSVFMRGLADPSAAYNPSIDSLVWEIFSIGFILISVIILLQRRPAGWNNGLAFFALVLIGHVVDAFFPNPGNYSGIVRLMYLTAFQFLPTLTQRFPTPVVSTSKTQPKKSGEPAKGGEKESEKAFRERRRYSTDPKTLHALLSLAAEVDANKIGDDVTRAIAQAMLADLCFLIYPSDDKRNLIISGGYDLIREESLEGGQIDKDAVPLLANAVIKGKPLRLPASATSADLKGLGDLLGLGNAGNLLNVPIISEKGPMAGILLLSPYSNRVWSPDDQSFLGNHVASLIPVLERGQRIAANEQARERAERNAEEALNKAMRAENDIRAAKSEVEQIREQTKDGREIAEKYNAASKLLDDFKGRMAELEKEKNELSKALATAAPGNDQFEQELKLSLKEVARLQNTIAEANMKILTYEKRPSGISGEQAEVIASISQELRQPMSSIVGYADLLLGESVGILGALQRKFIERIKASTERIGSLIDDLIQISTLETGLMSLKPEAIDLNLIIDNAMAYTSSQLREKNIALRIDIPKTLQPIYADREAMQQILIHLLQNAGAATPVEGTISLRVRTQLENGQEYVLVQVSDTGGGIPEKDLPRVFSRLYRAENVLIQGVGDTGVGLSIAKALTEAQGGRIWVETELSVGSTFSVMLPITQQAQPDKAKEG
jgi:signal transduction histidine kinase